MTQLESTEIWPEILRRKDELSLTQLASRAGTTPGAVAAALVRTGALRQPMDDDADALPPEPGESESGDVLPEVVQALDRLRPGSKDVMIADHAALLGRVPDAEIARRSGVSIRTVASFRARHEIPGYRGPRRTTRDRPAPRPPHTTGASTAVVGGVAFQVRFLRRGEEATGVVVARDLAEAAALAERSGQGEVVMIRRAGAITA